MSAENTTYSVDWNNAAEVSIATALGMIPEVGAILGALVFILWPHDDDVWSEIKQQVEELIQQELDQYTYETVQNDLTGLQNVFNDYLQALQDSGGDPQNIADQWDNASDDCDLYLPDFQARNYQVLLLPLFAQFANLHLSLLRDAVLFGAQWGWTPEIVAGKAQTLTQKIGDYMQYAQNVYSAYLMAKTAITPPDNSKCEPFRTLNAYTRQMTLTVLDFVNLWPYFDATKYPGPVNAYLPREIYSDPVGKCDDSGNIVLPATPPTAFPTGITVWWDQFRVYGLQLTYPAGGGPNGVTQTPVMGTTAGSSRNELQLNDKSVVVAWGSSGDIIDSLRFNCNDGTTVGPYGNAEGGSFYLFIYTNELLSSIHVNGVSVFYNSADSLVFGFKFDPTTQANTDALRRLYIATPTARKPDELASRCAARTADAGSLAAQASAENWDAQRQDYWTYLKSPAAKRVNPS